VIALDRLIITGPEIVKKPSAWRASSATTAARSPAGKSHSADEAAVATPAT